MEYKKIQQNELQFRSLTGLSPAEKVDVRGNRTVPLVSATASRDKDGIIHISLSNIDADEAQEMTIEIPSSKATKVSG
ncbi:hypothetical protein EZS27_020824 [termite gut metagenome]|uniref:Uncharacterized protein n=1 Tax=termite gut metagenome TaxID=433724 RepID=A0A5J4RA88_9ZZZZ